MEAQPSEPQRGLTTRWVELVVALSIVGGAALVIYDSLRIGATWSTDGPTAGYFPYLVGLSLGAAALWLVGRALWSWKKLAGQVFVEWGQLRLVLSVLLPTIAYVAVMRWLGLYVASALYIGAFMVWKGKYGVLATLAVSIGVPVVAFLLFEVWFLVPLPKGPVEQLLGY